jgi:hypothetical protein
MGRSRDLALLCRYGLAKLGLRGGRLDDDRRGQLEEIAERETANPASLIAKTPPVLVRAWASQDLHPRRTALARSRWGDDPFWIKILGL